MIDDLKPYPEYKESGLPWLGKVPGHWKVRKLKQVSHRFWSGGTPESGNDKYYCDAPHGYPWLMISDLTHQRRVRRTRKHITQKGLESRRLEILPAGTVLFSMYASLGTAAVLAIDAAVNQAIIGITPCHAVISSDFTLYSLEQLKTSLPALASSSTQSNLNAEKVKSLQINLPPPDEQAAIVQFLDWANGRLERTIRAKRKVIALLNEQKQAIIHRAVTRGLDPSVLLKPSGIPWLGDIPRHWEVRRLKFVASRIVDCLHATPQYSDSGDHPAIRTADVSPGVVHLGRAKRISPAEYARWTARMEPREGDILYSREGERFGIAACVPAGVRLCISQRMMVFRIGDNDCSAFVMRSLNSQSTYGQALQDVMGATAPHVNVATIRNYFLALPKKQEQEAIVAHVESETLPIDAAISRPEREIELLREYRTRLVADVVTGKLDVREAAARLPDEAPLDTVEDDTDLVDETEAADEEASV